LTFWQPDIIIGFLLNSLEQEEPDVAATAVVGIAKLILAGMVTNEEVRYFDLLLLSSVKLEWFGNDANK
jgi:condensin complex subunit 3